MRAKAILKALFYGIAPWWMYERKCHYECSYSEHLTMNLKMAYRWATKNEREDDVEFELA